MNISEGNGNKKIKKMNRKKIEDKDFFFLFLYFLNF